MTKNFITALFLVFGLSFSMVQAQEATTTVDADAGMEEMMDVDLDIDAGIVLEEDLSEEQEQVLEDAEELEENDIDSSLDLEGEIILRTEDEVVIKKSDGSTVKVEAKTYKKGRPGAHRRAWAVAPTAPVGSIITTATVASTEGGLAITSNGKTTPVTNRVSVSKGGSEIASSEVTKEDEVVALFDDEGELIGLEVVVEGEMMAGDEDNDMDKDETSKNKFPFVVIIIVLVLLAALIAFRKKK